MAIIDDAKKIAESVKQMGDAVLYEQIVSLQSEISSLAGHNFEVETELLGLKAKLKVEKELEFRQPYYWRKNDVVPFCPKCKDKDGVLARMSDPQVWNGGVRRHCHVCEKVIYEKPMRLNTFSIPGGLGSWTG